MPVATLRQHRFARLLQKPQLKSVLASCGKSLTPALLNDADGDPTATTYSLSLGVWGKDHGEQIQMSRRGANLVLQLNFNHAHNRACRKLLGLRGTSDPFNCSGHPALDDARPATLGLLDPASPLLLRDDPRASSIPVAEQGDHP